MLERNWGMHTHLHATRFENDELRRTRSPINPNHRNEMSRLCRIGLWSSLFATPLRHRCEMGFLLGLKHVADFFRRGGLCEFFAERAAVEESGHSAEELDVIAVGAKRSDEQKSKIYRLVIDGLVFYRVFEPDKAGHIAVDGVALAVWNRDPLANTGGHHGLSQKDRRTDAFPLFLHEVGANQIDQFIE